MHPTPRPSREEDSRAARWRDEASYFDEHAPGEVRGIDPSVALRYAQARRSWFNKEYRFRLLGRMVGRRVLDVGCGTGDNAILLARAGAEVTAVDISPRSVAVAEARARASGLAVVPRFVCAPIEVADLPPATFDVVWGDGILHHVIRDLDSVLSRLRELARPGARFLFSEPVNRFPALRRLREALPIPIDGTPDERPLEEAELAIVRRHVPDLTIRSFGLLGRVNRFVLPAGYEAAPLGRRILASALCIADHALLSAAPLDRVAGMAVLHGRFPA